MSIAQHLTLKDFLELPEAEPALEFADGEISQKVSPKGKHSALQTEFIEIFNRFGRPRRLARAFSELRVSFAGASRVPDVAVYRWERVPRTETGEIANDVFEPPDITVEIVSPGQSVNALVRRCLWYVENGVRVALLVDPDDQSVLTFRPNQPTRVAGRDDTIDLSDIIPDFSLNLPDLFAALRAD